MTVAFTFFFICPSHLTASSTGSPCSILCGVILSQFTPTTAVPNAAPVAAYLPLLKHLENNLGRSLRMSWIFAALRALLMASEVGRATASEPMASRHAQAAPSGFREMPPPHTINRGLVCVVIQAYGRVCASEPPKRANLGHEIKPISATRHHLDTPQQQVRMLLARTRKEKDKNIIAQASQFRSVEPNPM